MVIHKDQRPYLKMLAIAGLMALATSAFGQPVADRVLSSAEINKNEGCTVIRVQFELPMQYVSHFPESSGDELRIKIRPQPVGSQEALSLISRDGTRPPFDEDVGLLSVEFVGRQALSSELILEFRRPLTYRVRQGRDYRSILIGIPGPDTTVPCP